MWEADVFFFLNGHYCVLLSNDFVHRHSAICLSLYYGDQVCDMAYVTGIFKSFEVFCGRHDFLIAAIKSILSSLSLLTFYPTVMVTPFDPELDRRLARG